MSVLPPPAGITAPPAGLGHKGVDGLLLEVAEIQHVSTAPTNTNGTAGLPWQ